MNELFYDGEEPPNLPNLPKRNSSDENAWLLTMESSSLSRIHLFRQAERKVEKITRESASE